MEVNPKPPTVPAVEAQDKTLRQDPERVHMRPVTGILVRARKRDGGFVNCDILHLERDSLARWLRSDSEMAVKVCLHIMGHSMHGV